MTETKIYPPTAEFTKSSHADKAKYDKMYAESVNDPEAFWGREGKRLDWIKPYTRVKNTTLQVPRCRYQMVRGWQS